MTDVLNDGIETIGTITNWTTRGYGWAWRDPQRPGDTENIFVHGADCADETPLAPGTRVKFRLITTPKGPRARRLKWSSSRSREQRPSAVRVSPGRLRRLSGARRRAETP